MAYFITGGTGFIGRNFIDKLKDREGDIYVLTRAASMRKFEEAENLEHPYFATKHDSEGIVRNECQVPWRVYRPAMVVGNSKTGEIDKIDGAYYFFKSLQKIRNVLPQWFPLIGIEGGKFNIVPVDYVVDAMDHIAHLDDLDGRCFHLTDPEHHSMGNMMNIFTEKKGQAPGLPLFYVCDTAASAFAK